MRRGRALVRLALLALLASAAAAQPVATRCHVVADGARVRARDPVARATRVVTAVGWGTASPRLVTARGDTVPLTAAHRVWTSGGRTARRTVAGAVLGWLAGIGVTVADCGLASTCGGQNPLPLIGAATATDCPATPGTP